MQNHVIDQTIYPMLNWIDFGIKVVLEELRSAKMTVARGKRSWFVLIIRALSVLHYGA